jgi:hypothetical protein
MRWIGLITVLLLGIGCAPPPKKTVEVTAPPPVDLSGYGTAVQLDATLEIKGMGTVWIEGSPFLLTLLETRWDEIETDKGTERIGRAKVRVWEPKGDEREKTVTIEKGRTKTALGYRITVSYAYEFYEKSSARHIPHARLIIGK